MLTSVYVGPKNINILKAFETFSGGSGKTCTHFTVPHELMGACSPPPAHIG